MSQALATRPRELTAGDLESAVLEVLTHRRRCTTIEDIVRILQAAGALKNSRIALIFPTHPHRMAVAEAVTRLHKAGCLAFSRCCGRCFTWNNFPGDPRCLRRVPDLSIRSCGAGFRRPNSGRA